MKVLYWNIRGIANKESRDSLFNFFKQVSPDIICIAEPMMSLSDFPVYFLRSINMHLLVYNLRDGISKLWVLVDNVNTQYFFPI